MNVVELWNASKVVRLPDGSDFTVLHEVSLSIAPSDRVAILGRSGSGKTTLLNVLGLIEPLTSGTLTVAGQEIHNLRGATVSRLRGNTFGFVYQRFCLMDHLTAVENVEAPLLHLGRGRRRWRRSRAVEALERVGLADRLHHRPAQLSGGEQQRVAIARAIVHEPKVILADEPTGSLDQETGTRVMNIIASLSEHLGTALVVVTHDREIAAVCNRVVQLDRGTVVSP